MTRTTNDGIDRYIYRAATTSRRHRHLVSVYFVERCRDSTIVARIVPLGLVSQRTGSHEIALRGLGRNVVLAGTWEPTASSRHDRVRVRSLEE